MDQASELTRIEAILEHGFEDPSLLYVALTHSSVKSTEAPSNERLEFLGDAVLGLVVAHHLHTLLPGSPEGRLSTLRSQIVRERTLARAFADLGLVPYLRIQPDLVTVGGAPPRSVLENAFEAILGALYLDGGLAAAERLVMKTLGAAIEDARQKGHDGNFKAILQQITQARYQELPVYRVLESTGPDHSRTFEISAEVGTVARGVGSGRSKRAAQQAAAREALRQLWQQRHEESDRKIEPELARLFGGGA